MKTMFFLSILVALDTMSVTTDSAYPTCQLPRVQAYHINGVATSRDKALKNKTALQMFFNRNIPGRVQKVSLAYNYSRGLSSDLYQTMIQKIQENPAYSKQIVQAFVRLMPDIITDSTIAASVKAALDGYYRRAARHAYIESDLAHIRQEFNNQLASDVSVLLVPHSQGNLFANAFYEGMSSSLKARTFITGIASPADSVAGDGTYLTSSNDLVIGGLRAAMPVLPANGIVGFTLDDPMGHNLASVYLDKGAGLMASLLQGGLDTLAGRAAALTGIFALTASWPENGADYDLHIQEPLSGDVWHAAAGDMGQIIGGSAGAMETYFTCSDRAGFYLAWLEYPSVTPKPTSIGLRFTSGGISSTKTIVGAPLNEYEFLSPGRKRIYLGSVFGSSSGGGYRYQLTQ